jgi:putative ABC transport system permease protein
MMSAWTTCRHAVRVLIKHAGVTAIVILTLALGIGAATAIFSVVYGVLLRPLPYPAPERLMAIWEINDRGTYSRLADPNFSDFRDRNRTFSAMARFTAWTTSVVGPGDPTRSLVARVTKDFFTTMGVPPVRGRGLTDLDARVGAEPVAIVSHRYWTQALGSAPVPSSLTLKIEDRTFTVVGVMPAGFQFPANVDLWVPAELERENPSRTSHNFQAVGRRRDGASAAEASGDLSAIAQDIIRNTSERGRYLMTDAAAVPLQASLTRRVGSTLYILLGAVSFLLLVACANVANLLLAQAVGRQRELAVRHALGASRGVIVRQFVAESLVLLAAGGAGGLVIAAFGIRALLSLAPADLPRPDDITIDRAVLGFAMSVSALVAIMFGLVTAVRATRGEPRDTLIQQARGQAGSAASQRLSRAIVAAQLAITLVLLIGAALLGRSLLRVLSVDPGFRTDRILAIDLPKPYSDEPDAKTRLIPFYENVLDRLRAIPGTEDIAAVSALPLDGGLPDGMFATVTPSDVIQKPGDLAALFRQPDRTGTADFCVASARYFHVLGIPLVRGRLFDDRDRAGQAHVAVISESLARAQWKGADPLGRMIEFGNMDGDLRPLTIVGIVGDTREYGLEQPPRPTVYVHLLQRPPFTTTMVMRSSADLAAITTAARGVLRQIAPDVPPRFRTFDQIVAASLGARHFNLALVGVFAGTALLLAVAGIYGVMSYSVTQRRREIGVRMALGARPGQVVLRMLGQGLATAGIGIAAGLLAALLLTRTLRALLFEVTPTDPLTFAAVIATLSAVAALACYVPARRAARIDPVRALRQD